MATSKTSQSAPLSGVAKDDAVGFDGDFTFTVADLLANDGGSVKNVTDQFRFGTTQADWNDQATYLTNHGITANADGSYTITSGAEDFQYMMQTGNKGTWSTASVDVTAPEKVVDPHLSEKELVSNWNFEEDFISYGNEAGYVIGAPTGWTDLTGGTVTPEIVKNWGGVGDDGSFGEGESQWLDSAGTPGNVRISTTLTGENDLAEGHTAQLSVSVAAQALSFGDQFTLPEDGELVFNFNGQEVLRISADDFNDVNSFHTFTANVTGAEGADTLEIYAVNQGDANSGFAIDHVSVHEWLI